MTDMTTWTTEQIRHWLRYGVSPATMGERTEPDADSAKAAYTVVFQNAITHRRGSSEQHDRDTFEAAVELANDFDKWPYNNTRVTLIRNADGHTDHICPTRTHRFDFDNHGNLLCVCGFRPTGSVEAAEHHAGVAPRNGIAETEQSNV